MERLLVRVIIFLIGVYLLAGCASTPYNKTTLDQMNRDIQNCILTGGHPRLGPDNTILCDP